MTGIRPFGHVEPKRGDYGSRDCKRAVEQSQECGEIKSEIEPQAVATSIAASLEGALMMSRIQRDDEPLRRVQAHLNRFLDSEVAAL